MSKNECMHDNLARDCASHVRRPTNVRVTARGNEYAQLHNSVSGGVVGSSTLGVLLAADHSQTQMSAAAVYLSARSLCRCRSKGIRTILFRFNFYDHLAHNHLIGLMMRSSKVHRLIECI